MLSHFQSNNFPDFFCSTLVQLILLRSNILVFHLLLLLVILQTLQYYKVMDQWPSPWRVPLYTRPGLWPGGSCSWQWPPPLAESAPWRSEWLSDQTCHQKSSQDVIKTVSTYLGWSMRPQVVFGEKEWLALWASVLQYWSSLNKEIFFECLLL